MISELYGPNLQPHETDARYYLRKMITKAKDMGYSPMVACETEFYVLRQGEGGTVTPYINTKFATSHSYDLINDYVQEVFSNLATMGVHLERLKKEYGHAQIEPTLRYTDALSAADAFVALKDVAKAIAAKRGLFASFMPKPYGGVPGSGCHIHLSLFDVKTKHNAFYNAKDTRGCKMSKLGYQFIGGVLAHMNGICVFGAPISNSYKRLLPGSWAPAHVCYGYDHRGVAVRIPSNSPHSDGSGQRVEYRVPDPSCNAYYAVGTLLESGLDPGDPLREDPAHFSSQELERRGIPWLPRTVGEAIAEAKKDQFIKETLGEMAFNEYIKVRESEWRDYREQVTPWEVENYLTTL
jgi:glutamine synthetase